MARNPSKSLYNLIHILSKTERRYLNLFIGAHFVGKNNKYLKLFQLLQNQKNFDDEEIKKLLYPDRKVNSSTFATIKNRLYQIILRTLIAYDETNSLDLNIYTELQKIKVLYKRGLTKECKELIYKLSEKVYDLNNPKLILELNSWKKKLDCISLDITSLEKNKFEINQSNTQAIERLSIEKQLESIYYDLFIKRMQEAAKSDSEYKHQLEQLINNLPVKLSETEVYTEKKWIYKILNYYYLIINDFKGYYTTSKELYDLVKNNEIDYHENPGDVIPIIANIIQSCSQLNKLDEIELYLPEFLELAQTNTIGLVSKKRAICSYHLNLLIVKFEKGEIEQGIQLAEDFLNTFQKEFYQPYLLNFCLIFSVLHFSNGNFEIALEWVQKITNLNYKLRKDLLIITRCISLMIHYELENHLLIRSLIRSTNRYIKKSFESSPIEVSLIKTIKELISKPYSAKEKTMMFKQFQQEIAELENVQNETKNFNNSFLNGWCQSKILNVTISQIFADKYAESKQNGL